MGPAVCQAWCGCWEYTEELNTAQLCFVFACPAQEETGKAGDGTPVAMQVCEGEPIWDSQGVPQRSDI